MTLTAGFDIGGTKTLGVALRNSNEIVASIKVPRPRSGNESVSQLTTLCHDFETELGDTLDSVGVGIAGAIRHDGSVRFSPNLPEIADFDLQAELAAALDAKVVVMNDATAATVAEARLGAGKNIDNFSYVALGTGIGTGFVLNGDVYVGANGFAGESGHIVIDRHGEPHITGVRGPWEKYASGNGLGDLARRWAADGRLPTVVEATDSIDAIRGEDVTTAVLAGAPDALELLDEFADDVAIGMTNLVYVLDPSHIVLGGGLVALGEELRSRVEASIAAMLIGADYRPKIIVLLAELGSTSAAIGAAVLAAE